MHKAIHPSERTVGVMGLGVFGADIASKLAALGYNVCGWSRTRKALGGVETFAGPTELNRFLGKGQILVNVLPLTQQTRGILDAKLFDAMPGRGALIHLGRGGHLNEADLVAALASGKLDFAMLDVFPTEPLPAGSPLWSHPRVFVTPHVASQPVSDRAERLVIENFNRFERGEEPLGRVDLSAGY